MSAPGGVLDDLEGVAEAPPARHANVLVRGALMAAGGLLVVIGVAGIFLPLVPTTVPLLLAAACFGKSSPAAYRWLTTNRWFGRYLRDYHERRGATLGAKVAAIVLLWAGMGLSAFLLQPPWWVDLMLAVIAVGVTWHLVAIKTLRDEAPA